MRIGGLASGIDTDSLIKEIMTAQKMPLDKLTQEKTWTEWQQESYRKANLSLSSLRTSASDMRLQGTFNSYSATSSDSSSLSVETTSASVNGTYKVKVISVAGEAKMHSANGITITNATGNLVPAKSTDTIGVAGKIKISGTTDLVEIKADMTFADVAKKLQDATAGKTPELRASFDNTTSRFFISTKAMGENQNFSLEFLDSAGTGANTALAQKVINNGNETTFSTSTTTANEFMTKATNGAVEFNGIEVNNLTSNKTTINGLTLNLVKAATTTVPAVPPATEPTTEPSTITVTVQSDSTKTFDTIKNFVTKYNEAIAEIEKQLVEKRYPDFQPLSDEQKKDMSDNEIELWEEKAKSGLLRNDPILKSAIQNLRNAFMNPVEGIDKNNINVLSEIGISTGSYSEGGKLFIDEDLLKEKLNSNPDEVMNLFTNKVGDRSVGVGARVYEELNNVIKNLSERAGSPASSVDNSTISKKIKQMNEEITRWQDRLVTIEDRYWRQFTAMEKAMSQMNSQSTWMQQNMLGGM
ncbi:flagellar filament capping protein FliD [Planomicrobium sp. CPCC 101079]|uniref:flagellar filament capping protein FliD n=1 Tax=Planomicrobium sp. CPCC 101079 TaxID=2599618 RepID=UPI0011B65F03|nr:flagellar filament capping protein FliD [Planomicrobium sp. CPCC 101079]TWT03675.1 flagellar cap protein [Planomicrobium sp. CPCC 101079]